MTDRSAVFKKLVRSDMVRSALQNHPKHQPIAMDDRMSALLGRLAKAEGTQDTQAPSSVEGRDFKRQDAGHPG
jgi:hypothetical protein